MRRNIVLLVLAPAAVALALAASPAPSPKPAPTPPKGFHTPEEAFDAILAAAETYDLAAFKEILGSDGMDIVATSDTVKDKSQMAEFVARAHEKKSIARDPKNYSVAILSVGAEDWPMPIPVVQKNSVWRFDTKRGRREILFRRIGSNELDAIQICRGYVEAQQEYAQERHDGSPINQYAQKVISTPGKHDGLAWQDPDGTWKGPVGEGVARALQQGYTTKTEPYHGYYFKVLKGQGPAAPLGTIDFVVKGAMVGGFALAAAPSDYEVTGVQTFIVSHDGIVYQKDLGPKTLESFKTMQVYNPDKTWTEVPE